MASFKIKYVIDIYALAREGLNDKTIGKHFGLTPAGFCGWKKTKASVRYALKRARSDRLKTKAIDWTAYIRNKIPPKLIPIWDDITEYEREENGYAKIKLLLNGKSKRVRQHLLVYALLACGFNVTKALSKTAISRKTFDYWLENDPDFCALINEVELTKKDFFEEGLINLVKQGDSPATIFANRTMNRDRGYNESLDVRSSATISVLPIALSELNLPTEVLRIIMKAIENKQNMNKPLLDGQTEKQGEKRIDSQTVKTSPV
jgi:hypothetical protein